jgi:hypothetical protein
MKDRLLSKTPPVDYFSVRVADDRGACAHPVIPVLAERGGTQLQAPRPTENSIPSIYLASGETRLGTRFEPSGSVSRYLSTQTFGPFFLFFKSSRPN